MKRKTKNILTKVLTGILAVGVVAGTAAGAKALYDYSHSELKTIHPTFNVGGLDNNGEHVDQDTTLYSNEFLAQGLQIKLDFKNDIKYQVYYYDEDSEFVKATDVMDGNYNISKDTKIENVEFTSARVLIIPQWTNLEATEDKTLEELQVVNWKNKHSFVNQMEIKVNREQVQFATFTLPGYDETNGDFSEEYLTLKFEEGMTWKDWVYSDYNTIGMNIDLLCPYEAFPEYHLGYSDDIGDLYSVKTTDKIIANTEYYFG